MCNESIKISIDKEEEKSYLLKNKTLYKEMHDFLSSSKLKIVLKVAWSKAWKIIKIVTDKTIFFLLRS